MRNAKLSLSKDAESYGSSVAQESELNFCICMQLLGSNLDLNELHVWRENRRGAEAEHPVEASSYHQHDVWLDQM
jgi:hypothetical protein